MGERSAPGVSDYGKLNFPFRFLFYLPPLRGARLSGGREIGLLCLD